MSTTSEHVHCWHKLRPEDHSVAYCCGCTALPAPASSAPQPAPDAEGEWRIDGDDELQLVAAAIRQASNIQEFIWADCYPRLRPYDAEGWRLLFQKRVDSIANADLTQHGGLALLRK